MSDAIESRSKGWVPVREALSRDDLGNPTGLAVFLVDEAVSSAGMLDRLVDQVEYLGFDTLAARKLSKREQDAVAAQPWVARSIRRSFSPAVALVGFDLEPVAPTPQQSREAIGLDNRWLFGIERAITHRVIKIRPEVKSRPIILATRNADEARQAIDLLLPEEWARLGREIQRTRDQYATPLPVIRRLGGYGRRAKVELVEYEGRMAVCKTFRPGRERFLERELVAHLELSRGIPEIPPALAYGPNWLLTPYYENTLRVRRRGLRLLPLDIAKRLLEILEQVYEAGYAHLDLQVKNVIVDRKDGLKLLDFEHLYRYEQVPRCFEASFDLAGAPAGLKGDLPGGPLRSVEPLPSTYVLRLEEHVGLSLRSLRNDPEWLQHLKRAFFVLTGRTPQLLRWLARRAARTIYSYGIATKHVATRGRSRGTWRSSPAAAGEGAVKVGTLHKSN
ncbi:MAG: hypothetical protein H0X65_08270 [Gemmatimonadetes bacterium]|nr:hypothetical protein [Gemmatimonadota bacterium]